MEGRRWTRTTRRFCRWFYRPRRGQNRHFTDGDRRDAMATVRWAWALILMLLDKLGRERYRRGFWKLLPRPGWSLSPTVRWPKRLGALSTPWRKTTPSFCFTPATKRYEAVGWTGPWSWRGSWAAAGLSTAWTGKFPLFSLFNFYFIFSVFYFVVWIQILILLCFAGSKIFE
jgi:hypothetical protein